MKEYISAEGERRLWFGGGEIDRIMEVELNKSDLFPDPTYPSVNIESFLETHLGVKLDLYAVLGAGVLGETRFIRGSRPLVLINRDLTTEAERASPPSGRLGRWRATLAHEAAHVVLHRKLFEVPCEQKSFSEVDNKSPSPLLTCLKRNISFNRVPSDWKEVQANRGMASLLMPRRLFSGLVRNIVGSNSAIDLSKRIPERDSTKFKALVRELSVRCEVSREAARIRLDTCGLMHKPQEPRLNDTHGSLSPGLIGKQKGMESAFKRHSLSSNEGAKQKSTSQAGGLQ